MKTKAALLSAVGLSLLLAAAIAAAASNQWQHRYQTSNVIDISGAMLPYQGAAWLDRSRDAVKGRIMTTVSTANEPYTLWIVIFNNPAACVDGCGESDLGSAEVDGSVFNGSGAISASDGNGGGIVNIDFDLSTLPLANDLFILGGNPDGLKKRNGFGAEIHLVIDKHPAVPAGMSWIKDLTTTHFPGMGPNTGDRVAVFLSCPDMSCPDSAL